MPLISIGAGTRRSFSGGKVIVARGACIGLTIRGVPATAWQEDSSELPRSAPRGSQCSLGWVLTTFRLPVALRVLAVME